jgi:hypothetical protein
LLNLSPFLPKEHKKFSSTYRTLAQDTAKFKYRILSMKKWANQVEMKRTKRDEMEAAWEGRRFSERNARIGMLREDAHAYLTQGESEPEIVREEKSRSAWGVRESVNKTDL